MSHKNAETRHQKCKLEPESALKACAVIAAESSQPKVSLQKRKEEAKETLYLNRI